jgi:peptidyl-prolyl cis-trans isomerase B (cyclophilin B)
LIALPISRTEREGGAGWSAIPIGRDHRSRRQ